MNEKSLVPSQIGMQNILVNTSRNVFRSSELNRIPIKTEDHILDHLLWCLTWIDTSAGIETAQNFPKHIVIRGLVGWDSRRFGLLKTPLSSDAVLGIIVGGL